jgi:HAD superfamily hydrolase (TIGR01549 family)
VILLLDLDDTLLGNRMDAFLPAYLQALAARMAPYADSGLLIKSLLAATRKMVENDQPDRTLEAVFDSLFFPALGLQRAEVQPVIDAFYKEDFPKLQSLTEFRPEAVELVEEAISRGYTIGIATNPLFPRTAILQRMAWAGIPNGEYPFALVPAYDTFHFSKPNPAYYAEFLGYLGWPEEEVLMVGDDVENDFSPASELGLPVFLIENGRVNQRINESASQQVSIVGHGGLKDIIPWMGNVSPEALRPNYTSPEAMRAILRATPAVLNGLCTPRPADCLYQRPGPKEWSPAEVLCHLRDVEAEVNLPRLRKVLENSNPFLPGQDTDRWAEERGYIHQDGWIALREFTRSRLELLKLLEGMQPEDWQREARHAIFGPTQLHELVNIIAGHDRLHIQQVYQAIKV